MSSSTVPPPSSAGTNSSMWANQSGPNRSGWGRGGEPGSAFRGLGKGRPGRGGGRGGRGAGRVASGRGAAPSRTEDNSTKPNADTTKDKPAKAPVNPPKEKVPPSPAVSIPPQSNNNSKPAKPKGPSRKPSEQKPPRKAPPVNPGTLPAPAPISPTTSTSSRGGQRRKRGPSQNKGSSGAPPRKGSLSAEHSIGRLRAEKPPTAPVKDLPPHLAPPPTSVAPTFDIKHDIDALVERVRAVAMDRPYTPGSHIDWAGEDDDSLPDLDDWGVPSIVTGASKEVTKSNIISPILQDTLRPLPSMADIHISTPASILEEVDADSLRSSSAVHTPHAPVMTKSDTIDSRLDAVSESDIGVPQIAVELSSGPQEELLSHESAETPDKPSQPKTASKVSSQPHPLPPKPTSSSNPPPTLSRNHTPDPLNPDAVKPRYESGLTKSLHAPSSAKSMPDSRPSSSKESSPERSLSASIHATVSNSYSAPSHLSSHYVPRGGFNPSHNRAHTVGRFPIHQRPPHSASTPSSEHSDSERPRRGDNSHHARTHSSPPTGPGTAQARAHHTTRPIISGDAISKLVRTLGGTSPPKRETPVTSATKE